MEAKYFSERLDDAISQGLNGPDKENFLVIGIEVTQEIFDKLFKSSDIDAAFMKGRTVVVSGREELDLINKTIDGVSVIGKK